MQQSRVKIKLHLIIVKVSHNNINVVVHVSVLKKLLQPLSCRFANFYNGGRNARSL